MNTRELPLTSKIFAIVSQCGSISYKSIALLGGNKNNKTRRLERLMDKGWLVRTTINYPYYYYYAAQGRKQKRIGREKRFSLVNIADHYEEYANYLNYDFEDIAQQNTGRLRYVDDSRIKKTLRQSEFMAMLCEADVMFHRGEKPFPSDSVSEKVDAYYEGREIKDLSAAMTNQLDEARLSRCYGSLVLNGSVYSVFDAERFESMRTTKTYEGAYLDVCAFVFGVDRPEKRVLLADNCKHIPEFLFSSYVPERKGGSRLSSGSATDKLLDDAFYEHTYLVPKIKEGIKMIEIMRLPDFHARLNEYLGLRIHPEDIIPYEMRSDGKQKEGDHFVYQLNFLDMDLDELLLFLNMSGLRKERQLQHRFEIHVYDFAKEAVENACHNDALTIISHNINDVYEELVRREEKRSEAV